MIQENVLIRFDGVSFAYNDAKVILDEADFSVRKNSIITIIGQNGAKSTIFKLLLGRLKPQKRTNQFSVRNYNRNCRTNGSR